MVKSVRAENGRRAEKRGRLAEMLAAFYLGLKGYQILERRYRSATGEIDLVAMRGKYLVFVEVKARPDVMRGMESIRARQRQRLIRTARIYVSGKPDLAQAFIRFDAIIIRPLRIPVHIVNAWSADDPTGG